MVSNFTHAFLILAMLHIVLEVVKAGAFQSVDPTWKVSAYFRANNEKVIKVKTGNDQTPQYTFTFSSPLPGVPNLAYGIKGYEGSDFLGQQIFEIRREDLTASTFRVSCQIYGVTNLMFVNVAYMAIDQNFPHLLNSFDNVPVSYGSVLVNTTVKSSSPTYYQNIISFYDQAGPNLRYRNFSMPLSNNKILLFMTAFQIWATFAAAGVQYPVSWTINYEILTNSTYKLRIDLYRNATLSNMRFSQIMFDEQDVKSTNTYFLVYYVWTTNVNGGFVQIPIEFKENFIMGIQDFRTVDGKCGIQYEWDFNVQSGIHGVRLQPSIITYGNCGQNETRSTVFYMKTWQCSVGYSYFNLSSNKCQNGCGDYYFQNAPMLVCDPCHFSCQACTGPRADACLTCSANDNRIKDNGNCVCAQGYFDDLSSHSCGTCTDKLYQCADCTYTLTSTPNYKCVLCKSGYFMDATNFKCINYLTCNPSGNQFVNVTNNLCAACVLQGCTKCNSLYSCQICDASNQYFIDPLNTDICKKCIRAQGCLLCKSLTTCQTCDTSNGWFLKASTNICVNCTFGCSACDAETGKCSTCKSGYYNTNGICQCNYGTYLNFGLTPWSCQACHNECERCTQANNSSCTKCKDSQNRVLVGSQCIMCTMIGCTLCQTLTQCKTCDQPNKYYQDLTNPNICTFCIPSTGCNQCKSLTTCVSCITTIGYFMNTITETCTNCTYGCVSCNANLGNCISCGNKFLLINGGCVCLNGTYLDQSLSPSQWSCQQCHSSCLRCSGVTKRECTLCSDVQNRYLQNGECILCGLEGCVLCASKSVCTTCDNTLKYWPDLQSPNLCKKCVPPLGCLQCKTLTTCQTCNEAKGYYLGTNDICVDCGSGCTGCVATTTPITSTCLTCANGFQGPLNGKCSCPAGKYEVRLLNKCLLCNSICKTCTGSSEFQCTSCYQTQQMRMLIANRCLCRNNYRQSQTLSLKCSIVDIKTCDPGFFYVQISSQCQQICGDGLMKGQQECDDGNQQDGDGCSRFCTIEPNYKCLYYPVRIPQSLCNYQGQIQIADLKVTKAQGQNTLTLNFQIQPRVAVIDKMNLKQEIQILGLKTTIKEISIEEGTGRIKVVLAYEEDPSAANITVNIKGNMTDPSQTGGKTMPSTSITLNMAQLQTVNNIRPGFFPPSVYQDVTIAQIVVYVAMGVALGALAISLVIKNALPILQTVTAMQVCYLSLGTMTSIHPLTATLYQAKYLMGYNEKSFSIDGLQSPNEVSEPNISALGYETSFISNVNVMILVQASFLIVTCFVYLLAIKNATFKTPHKYFQRALLIMVLFNIANVFFSASLITTIYPLELTIAGVSVLTSISQIIHVCVYYKTYLGFDLSFNLMKVKFKTFMLTLLLSRALMYVAPAVLRQNSFAAATAVLCVQGVTCIVLTVLRPFSGKLANGCMLIGEYGMLVFLGVNEAVVTLGDTLSQGDMEFALSWGQIAVFIAMASAALVSAVSGMYFNFIAAKATKVKVNLPKNTANNPLKQKLDFNYHHLEVEDISNADLANNPLPNVQPLVIDLDRFL